MRSIWAGIAALGMVVAAAPAAAAQFTFSYGFGSDVYASGTITIPDAPDCGPGCYYVTNVTGQNRGAAITGYDFFADSDQQFYPTSTPHVTGSGLTYQVNSTSYNIYATGGLYNEVSFPTADSSQIETSNFVSFFNVSPAPAAPVPEPATWAMMIGGMALVGGAARRQRTRSPRTRTA